MCTYLALMGLTCGLALLIVLHLTQESDEVGMVEYHMLDGKCCALTLAWDGHPLAVRCH